MTESASLGAAVEAIVRRARTAAGRLGPPAPTTRLIVIDGPAGSGKTTLANAVGAALPAQVIHMDDLYEGWDGLEGSWDHLEAWVLAPLARGTAGRYRRFDWMAERWAEWHEVPVARYLVAEGCGAGRPEADAVACLRVWVEAPDELRLRRGLDRDGAAMRARWLNWMADEREHFARGRHRERADLRVDGWGRLTG